jgi:peptidoglycan/xylan/chitin deacetylase (PgdA/CDA1 family)
MFMARSILLSVLALLTPRAVAAAEGPSPLIIEHGPRDSTKVALTFDACVTGAADEFDEDVVSILLREEVAATLFITGRWAEKYPDWVVFLARFPQFELANHSYYHPHLTGAPDDRVLGELRRTQVLLMRLSGARPHYFRPPYGEVDERVAKLAWQAGVAPVQFDIASGDPDGNLTAEGIAKAVLRKARGGSIVVFHMNNNGKKTKEVLPAVIAGLRGKGYELVTVGELLTNSKSQIANPE